MAQYQHKVIDRNGNIQMEVRSFPQSIAQEKAVEARYLELKELKETGGHQCPNCGKFYRPVLTRVRRNVPVQEEFPDAPAWQREQHISACCSEACYREFDNGSFSGLPMGEEA